MKLMPTKRNIPCEFGVIHRLWTSKLMPAKAFFSDWHRHTLYKPDSHISFFFRDTLLTCLRSPPFPPLHFLVIHLRCLSNLQVRYRCRLMRSAFFKGWAPSILADLDLKGTIHILRQHMDWVGGFRKWPFWALLTSHFHNLVFACFGQQRTVLRLWVGPKKFKMCWHNLWMAQKVAIKFPVKLSKKITFALCRPSSNLGHAASLRQLGQIGL